MEELVPVATLEEIAERSLRRAEDLRFLCKEGGLTGSYLSKELTKLIQDLVAVNGLINLNNNRDS
ncbi:hypothetical protein [Bacillus cereus group sp. N21]|uniref:hypothetical protein n=1 Tax=Bacillus cereus group sp. N21 TaxID=2794591 RepID=UPI0018F325B6|nr:hypothetical protein [Bacillus cereus group sp. N21]MBJ8031459.1 hypothetical protein [Bacillus cereus group sp. N21]